MLQSVALQSRIQWARSDSRAQTVPAQSATQLSIGHNEWARSVDYKGDGHLGPTGILNRVVIP